jgi:hypothetical protein
MTTQQTHCPKCKQERGVFIVNCPHEIGHNEYIRKKPPQTREEIMADRDRYKAERDALAACLRELLKSHEYLFGEACDKLWASHNEYPHEPELVKEGKKSRKYCDKRASKARALLATLDKETQTP